MVKHEKSKVIGKIQNLLPEQSTLHDLGGTKMGDTCINIAFLAMVKIDSKIFFGLDLQRFA